MPTIHIGHHYFGAGNAGDDLMLAGFFTCLGESARHLRFTCCCPHDLVSQRKRFPQVEWLRYTPGWRRAAIANADSWLGLGGTPFQSDTGPWFIDHLVEEAALCNEFNVPMHYLDVGVNNESVLQSSHVRNLVAHASHIWPRDLRSERLIQCVPGAAGKVSPGADLSHAFLAAWTARRDSDSLGLCLNLNETLARDLQVLGRFCIGQQGRTLCWLVQETRALPYTELELYAQLSPAARALVTIGMADYDAPTAAAILAPWPACGTLISSRYHATVVHAWAGSRIGIIAVNDKLRGLAEDLALPAAENLSEAVSPHFHAHLPVVPPAILQKRMRSAHVSVTAWHQAVLQRPLRTVVRKVLSPPRTQPMHIGILCGDSLGDLVLRQPMCRALLDNGYRVTIAAKDDCIGLLPHMDSRLEHVAIDVDPYHMTDPIEYPHALLRFIKRLDALDIDVILCPLYNRTILDEAVLTCLPHLIRMGFVSGVRAVLPTEDVLRRLGWGMDHSNLFSVAIPVAREWHETDKYAALLAQGFGIRSVLGAPVLIPTCKAGADAQQVLRQMGLIAGGFAVACPIGASNVAIKAVPDPITAAVAHYLSSEARLPLLLVGIDRERARLEQARQACNAAGADARVWIGTGAQLDCLLGLIACARLYFGSDSGPMHMAAALGVPVAAVFGGGTYPRFLPKAQWAYVAVNERDCFGCNWNCKYGRPLCIQSLQAEEVVEGVRRLVCGGDLRNERGAVLLE